MRQLLSVALCLCLLALFACGQAEQATGPEPTTAAAAAQATTTAPTTTTQAPTMPPIECPASYKDAPEEYKPILDALYTFVYAVRQDWSPEIEALQRKAWDIITIPSLAARDDTENLGYAVKDINCDGTPELVILYKDFRVRYDFVRPHVLSLYTLKDSKPVNLIEDHWGSRVIGRFATDGTLHALFTLSEGMHLYSYKLEPSADELTQLEDTLVEWRHDINEEHPLTQEEFDAMSGQYASIPNPMKFNFIPIEQ